MNGCMGSEPYFSCIIDKRNKKSCLIYIKQLFLLPEKDSNLHKQNQNLSSYP